MSPSSAHPPEHLTPPQPLMTLENSDPDPENDAEDEAAEGDDGIGVNYDIPPPPMDLLSFTALATDSETQGTQDTSTHRIASRFEHYKKVVVGDVGEAESAAALKKQFAGGSFQTVNLNR